MRVRTFMPYDLCVYATVNMIIALLIYHDRLRLAIALSVPVVKLDPSAVVRQQPRALLDTAKVEETLD